MGSNASGVPIHAHGDALNALAYGAKEWSLMPPPNASARQEGAAHGQRLRAGVGAAEPMRCVQYGGDVMFVPRNWAHGVRNLQETVGVALSCFSTEDGGDTDRDV